MFPKQERPADAMEEQTVTAEVNIKIETLEGATSEEISSPFLENIASFGDDPAHNSSKMVANPAFFQHPLSSKADLEEGSNPAKNNPTGGGGSAFKFQGRVPKVKFKFLATAREKNPDIQKPFLLSGSPLCRLDESVPVRLQNLREKAVQVFHAGRLQESPEQCSQPHHRWVQRSGH